MSYNTGNKYTLPIIFMSHKSFMSILAQPRSYKRTSTTQQVQTQKNTWSHMLEIQGCPRTKLT